MISTYTLAPKPMKQYEEYGYKLLPQSIEETLNDMD